jgi:hypothetical protein
LKPYNQKDILMRGVLYITMRYFIGAAIGGAVGGAIGYINQCSSGG